MSAGSVVVITGAARGIGLGLSQHFARLGARVVMNDAGVSVDGKTLDDAGLVFREAEQLSAAGHQVVANADSLAAPSAAQALVELAVARFGRIDAWIHGAAVLRGSLLLNVTDQDWQEVLATDLNGAFYSTRAALQQMRKQGAGRLLHMTSTSGLIGSVGAAAYGVAKAGLLGLVRVAALEASRYGVSVNAVVPFARTRITDLIPGGSAEREAYLKRAREARVEELSPLFEYLALHAAPDVSGQVFGARDRSVFIMSQPRPVASIEREAGCDAPSLAAQIEQRLRPSFTPLESEFRVFGEAALC